MALQARVGWRAYTPSSTLLLDTYTGSTVAFSMFKLRTAYSGNCIRVRRSSDNTEQDFGFVNNYLDTASLLTFVGANNGFVVKWYDQSGNANNLGQTTASNQPQIISSGSLITRNGIAFIQNGATRWLNLVTQINNTAPNNFSWWCTYEKDSTTNKTMGLTNGTNWMWLDRNATQYIDVDTSFTASPTIPINARKVMSCIYIAGGSKALYMNSSMIGSKTKNWINGANMASMSSIPSNFGITGTLFYSEYILWKTDQTSNKTGIESNINTRNLIY
jgi:hypothetical protein